MSAYFLIYLDITYRGSECSQPVEFFPSQKVCHFGDTSTAAASLGWFAPATGFPGRCD
jgi:hypothetical protein